MKIVGDGSHAAAFGPSAALTVHRTVIHSRFAAKATLDVPLIFAKINFYYFIKNIMFIRKNNIKIKICANIFSGRRGRRPLQFSPVIPLLNPQFIGLINFQLSTFNFQFFRVVARRQKQNPSRRYLLQ